MLDALAVRLKSFRICVESLLFRLRVDVVLGVVNDGGAQARGDPGRVTDEVCQLGRKGSELGEDLDLMLVSVVVFYVWVRSTNSLALLPFPTIPTLFPA